MLRLRHCLQYSSSMVRHWSGNAEDMNTHVFSEEISFATFLIVQRKAHLLLEGEPQHVLVVRCPLGLSAHY